MGPDDDKVFAALGSVIVISGLVLGGVTAFEGYYHNNSALLVFGATILLFTLLIHVAMQLVSPPKPNPNSIWNVLKKTDISGVLGKRSIGGGGNFTLTNRKRRFS